MLEHISVRSYTVPDAFVDFVSDRGDFVSYRSMGLMLLQIDAERAPTFFARSAIQRYDLTQIAPCKHDAWI